jgi:hypothetical protein
MSPRERVLEHAMASVGSGTVFVSRAGAVRAHRDHRCGPARVRGSPLRALGVPGDDGEWGL